MDERGSLVKEGTITQWWKLRTVLIIIFLICISFVVLVVNLADSSGSGSLFFLLFMIIGFLYRRYLPKWYLYPTIYEKGILFRPRANKEKSAGKEEFVFFSEIQNIKKGDTHTGHVITTNDWEQMKFRVNMFGDSLTVDDIIKQWELKKEKGDNPADSLSNYQRMGW